MNIYVDEPIRWIAYHGAYADRSRSNGSRQGHMWCHLFADAYDCEELHAFAKRIGLKREWYHDGHYNLLPTKRALAVKLGAIEADRDRAVAIWKAQKERSCNP